MNAQVLLLLSDVNSGVLLSEYLRSNGYDVDYVSTSSEGLSNGSKKHYDLCIVGMREGAETEEVVSDLRRGTKSPIIAIQRVFDKDEQLGFYASGADDCVVLPILPDLLVCKMGAMLRRNHEYELSLPEEFCVADVHFDSIQQRLEIGENVWHLSTKENNVLLLLFRYENATVDRSLILKTVWQGDTYFNSRSLSVYINHLRKYFENSEALSIMSVHGRGYKLLTRKE